MKAEKKAANTANSTIEVTAIKKGGFFISIC